MDLKTPHFIALTAEGGVLAAKLAEALDGKWHGLKGRTTGADTEFEHATDHIRDVLLAGHPVVGICAAGILIRAV